MKKELLCFLLISCVINYSFSQELIDKSTFSSETNLYLSAIKKVSKTNSTQNLELYHIFEEFISSKYELQNSGSVETGEKVLLNQKIYNLYQLKLTRTLNEDQLILWNQFEVTIEMEWLKAKKELQDNFLIAKNEADIIADQNYETGLKTLRGQDDSQKDGIFTDANYQRKKELQALIDEEHKALRAGKGDNSKITELKNEMALLDHQDDLSNHEKTKTALNAEKEFNSNWVKTEKTRKDQLSNEWNAIFKEQYKKTWDITLSKF